MPRVERILESKNSDNPEDWFFSMSTGTKVISLADQFSELIYWGQISHGASGDKFSRYSLRHFYAVMALRDGIGIYDVARNMGTSVEMIQKY